MLVCYNCISCWYISYQYVIHFEVSQHHNSMNVLWCGWMWLGYVRETSRLEIWDVYNIYRTKKERRKGEGAMFNLLWENLIFGWLIRNVVLAPVWTLYFWTLSTKGTVVEPLWCWLFMILLGWWFFSSALTNLLVSCLYISTFVFFSFYHRSFFFFFCPFFGPDTTKVSHH